MDKETTFTYHELKHEPVELGGVVSVGLVQDDEPGPAQGEHEAETIS